ncbi:hypothetical protein [Cellulomonas sp. PhB150]|uniref:hypothetical protein n=1 Tax=Cellulomonas sp. PhB150 TaxID=2485188 RepID=UPI000F47FCF9|nr:hypothetical protein [Cellulomonas sp. PhB150]
MERRRWWAVGGVAALCLAAPVAIALAGTGVPEAAAPSAGQTTSAPTPSACIVGDVVLGTAERGEVRIVGTTYAVTEEGDGGLSQVENTWNPPDPSLAVSDLPEGVPERAVVAAVRESADEGDYLRSFDDLDTGDDDQATATGPGRTLAYSWVTAMTTPFTFTCGGASASGLLHTYDFSGSGTLSCEDDTDRGSTTAAAARALAVSIGEDCSLPS